MLLLFFKNLELKKGKTEEGSFLKKVGENCEIFKIFP